MIICAGRDDVRVSTVYWSMARWLTLGFGLGDVEMSEHVVNGARRAHFRCVTIIYGGRGDVRASTMY